MYDSWRGAILTTSEESHMVSPSQAKAILALIVGMAIVIPAGFMISGNPLSSTKQQSTTISDSSDSELSTSPPEQPPSESEGVPPLTIPQPLEPSEPSSETEEDTTQNPPPPPPPSPPSPPSPTTIFDEEGTEIGLFTGYWGKEKNAQPLASLSGNIITIQEPDDRFTGTWLNLKTRHENERISMRLPLENSVFQGYLQINDDTIDTISGLLWHDEEQISYYQIFFRWNDISYWIIGLSQIYPLGNTTRNGLPGTFDGYWGNFPLATPLSSLTGEIIEMGSSEENVTAPWLFLKGYYQSSIINIRFPMNKNPFWGDLSFYENWTGTQMISGTQWYESSGNGFFISFFMWNNVPYWIAGMGYELQ